LVGDPVYGGRRRESRIAFGRQALHAERLELAHPVTRKAIGWHVPTPPDMRRLIASLKGAA
jgi:23S rRNA pseudouridine1911/1915/1917 synthase